MGANGASPDRLTRDEAGSRRNRNRIGGIGTIGDCIARKYRDFIEGFNVRVASIVAEGQRRRDVPFEEGGRE